MPTALCEKICPFPRRTPRTLADPEYNPTGRVANDLALDAALKLGSKLAVNQFLPEDKQIGSNDPLALLTEVAGGSRTAAGARGALKKTGDEIKGAVANTQELLGGNKEAFAGAGSGSRRLADTSGKSSTILSSQPNTILLREGKGGGGVGKNNVQVKYQLDKWQVKPLNVKDSPSVYQHGKFGKIYQDPKQTVGNKAIWYSKDTAEHGGSKYKLFVEQNKQFVWIADIDAAGKVMSKHKGPTGKNINIKTLSKIK